MSDYGEHTTPETTETAGGPDTESDGAREAIQNLVNDISRSQGGTENVVVDGSKGEFGDEGLDTSERVNCDPQAFGFELPRCEYGNDHGDR